MHRLLACSLLVYASPGLAAQIVAMDVTPAGGVKKGVAAAVTPVLHSELSRVQGVSLITQEDIRALALLDATKQGVGCDDRQCMADVAGALGAELLLSAQLSRLGRSYNLTLTLIQVDGAKVLRRVTGSASGSAEAATEAVQAAVRDLFAGDLPEAAKGPASLSRRAYRAALAGLRATTLDISDDGRASRRRVILDLVRTELDFDAEPKLEALRLEVARGANAFGELVAMAKSAQETAQLVACIATYREIGRDLERVKEIRGRARERGQVPSPRPLRFEAADIPKRRADAGAKAYTRAWKAARQVVTGALKAWNHDRQLPFAQYWVTDRRSRAMSTFERERNRDREKGVRWELQPLHAATPQQFDRMVKDWVDDQRLTVLRRGVKGSRFFSSDRIRLRKVKGNWRIRDW